MGEIDSILRPGLKPREKQTRPVESLCSGTIEGGELVDFFPAASDVDKGTCAGAMKHVSGRRPEIPAPHVGRLIEYIDHRPPRSEAGYSRGDRETERREAGMPAEIPPFRVFGRIVRFFFLFPLDKYILTNYTFLL